MATGVFGPERAQIGERTLRKDRWWLYPLITAIVLGLFVIYATFRAFWGQHYYTEPYLSPFFSPCLSTACVEGSAEFGTPIGFLPTWFSPALIILVFPLGFRLTCYYYRKAYYRSFWMSPPACAVAEPHKKYTGETRFPLIFQNIHRYFWYAAMLYPPILLFEAVRAFRDEHGEWGHMGLGALVLLANAILLFFYTVSCHSCRHIMGGRLRSFSKHPIRYRLWTWISRLNMNHAMWAWVSLFSVAIADFYVWGVSAGFITDIRFF